MEGGRGGKKLGFSWIKQINLGLSHIKTDHSYCRAPNRNFEYGGRLRVQKCGNLKRIDVEQGNLPKGLLKPRQTRDRSLCMESVETTKKIHILENRPIQHGERCISNKLVTRFKKRFPTSPPFSLIDRVLAKFQREKATMILVTPSWQTQAWFSKLLDMSIQIPILLPSYPGLLTNPKREVHRLLQNQSLRLVAWKVSEKSYLQKEF